MKNRLTDTCSHHQTDNTQTHTIHYMCTTQSMFIPYMYMDQHAAIYNTCVCFIYVCVYVYIYLCVCVCVYMCVYMYVYMYVYVCMCVCIYTHTNIHTYIFICHRFHIPYVLSICTVHSIHTCAHTTYRHLPSGTCHLLPAHCLPLLGRAWLLPPT